MLDVLVAGGGPAGLAVAIGAARAGLDVGVCERRGGVIDKACGEGLMPGALRALQRLGIDPVGFPIAGITYRQDDRVVHAPFTHGPGRGVRRTVLHEAMRHTARVSGVALYDQPVGPLEQFGDHVVAGGRQARYLVAADGLHSGIRRAVGLRLESGRPARWGQRRHYALAPATQFVEVTWARDSEAYVTPVAPDTIGVAVLSCTRVSFAEQLKSFPALVERLRGAQPASDVRGAGPLRQDVSGRVSGRVLLVGDAAGYIDALTGEGLALALAGAAELVGCLAADRPQDYDRAWLRVSRRSRWITGGLLWARRRPRLSRTIVPLATRAPRVFTAAVDQLAG